MNGTFPMVSTNIRIFHSQPTGIKGVSDELNQLGLEFRLNGVLNGRTPVVAVTTTKGEPVNILHSENKGISLIQGESSNKPYLTECMEIGDSVLGTAIDLAQQISGKTLMSENDRPYHIPKLDQYV